MLLVFFFYNFVLCCLFLSILYLFLFGRTISVIFQTWLLYFLKIVQFINYVQVKNQGKQKYCTKGKIICLSQVRQKTLLTLPRYETKSRPSTHSAMLSKTAMPTYAIFSKHKRPPLYRANPVCTRHEM